MCLDVQCRSLWDRVRGEERWGKAWAVQALAAVQRLELSLGAFADSLYSLTQVCTAPHITIRCITLNLTELAIGRVLLRISTGASPCKMIVEEQVSVACNARCMSWHPLHS